MGKIAGVFALVILVFVIIMFGPMNQSINDTRIDTRTDILSAPTGAGELTADVVLNAPLWNDNTIYVLAISSTVGTDVPNALSYDEATRTLTVYGLTASEGARSLTIEYNISAFGTDGVQSSIGDFIGYWPLLIGIAIIAVVIGIATGAFSSGRR